MNRKRLFTLLMLFGLMLTTLTAIIPNENRSIPLPRDPELMSGKLTNGLTYYIMANGNPKNRAELRLFVNAGSVNEDSDQLGLAHFTEHMAFNGTKNFAKSEMVDYLSSIGMGYHSGLNGMTSYDFTVYMFKLPTDDLEKMRKGMLILSDMAHQVSFEPVEIERERGVIIEEWRLGQSAQSRISNAQNAVRFAGSRYAERSPIGTYEVLSTFDHDTLKRYYRDWYRPDNQSVVIIGDFDPSAMLALVQEYFGKIPARENPRPLEHFFAEENIAPQIVVTADREFPMTILNVMWKKPVEPMQSFGDYHDKLRSNLYYSMFNTRLEEHSKSADPPFSFAYSYDEPLIRTLSAATVFAVVTEGKTEAALRTILAEADRIERRGFVQSEFDRAKIKTLRAAVQAVAEKKTRESDDMTWSLFGTLAHGYAALSPEQEETLIKSLLDSITLEEVNAVAAQLISDKNMFVSLAAPDKKSAVYPTEAELLAIVNSVSGSETAEYADQIVDEPIIAQIPTPGKIKSETLIRRSGVSRWTLSNGIVVYAKKTNFKNDEVLLTAISPGGYSQQPESEIAAGQMLSDYVMEGGFGNFDSVSLSKALAGKVADISLSLGLNSEGFNASCSPQDLELMFQMLHQYGVNPRFEQKSFNSFVQRNRSRYQDRMLNPENVFFNELNAASYNYHPYRKSTTAEDIDQITLEQMRGMFTERYADFSDFTFFVVGNYDEALLKDYLKTYVATLPAKGRMERYKDVGMRTVKGHKEIVFYKGESDRSFVSHFISGDFRFSDENSVSMSALVYVLNEKLRENIRELRSGVYFIQAWNGLDIYPKPFYTLQTVMACSPERVEELNLAIFATMDSIRAGAFDDKYVAAARATLQKSYEERIRTNNYWLYSMQTNLWRKRPLDGFLNLPALYAKLDKATIVQAANRYLSFDKNRLTMIMLPEQKSE
ncbi:MAG: insulinase family protein [Candidatus Cloacimonadaceae bacterium]|nr:insulinase family protein [Candidatus Cloacimonadaceae bacterium]